MALEDVALETYATDPRLVPLRRRATCSGLRPEALANSALRELLATTPGYEKREHYSFVNLVTENEQLQLGLSIGGNATLIANKFSAVSHTAVLLGTTLVRFGQAGCRTRNAS